MVRDASCQPCVQHKIAHVIYMRIGRLGGSAEP
jgi:hypothetical protein